jgi:hypothetical protein
MVRMAVLAFALAFALGNNTPQIPIPPDQPASGTFDDQHGDPYGENR